jgi:hypothetical protein
LLDVTLTLWGAGLVPDDITAFLEHSPTHSRAKGAAKAATPQRRADLYRWINAVVMKPNSETLLLPLE